MSIARRWQDAALRQVGICLGKSPRGADGSVTLHRCERRARQIPRMDGIVHPAAGQMQQKGRHRFSGGQYDGAVYARHAQFIGHSASPSSFDRLPPSDARVNSRAFPRALLPDLRLWLGLGEKMWPPAWPRFSPGTPTIASPAIARISAASIGSRSRQGQRSPGSGSCRRVDLVATRKVAYEQSTDPHGCQQDHDGAF